MSRGSRTWLFPAGWATGLAWHYTVAETPPQWAEAGVSLALAALFLWAARPSRTPVPPPPTEPEPEGDAAHEFAQGLASDRELLAPLDEAALGYRAQLIADGWSPEAAESMALAFYTTQIDMLTNTTGRAADA